MRDGLSNVVVLALILIIVLNIIILIRHNIDNILLLYNKMLSELEKKFDILNENVDVINNGSVFVKSDTDCPIRYIVIYSNESITILPVNNSSIHIGGNLINYTNKIYVVTCNGNIVRIYVVDSSPQYSASTNNSILPVRTYLFQPGGKELLDPSICPITFHKYDNGYGILEVNTTFSLFCYNESGLVYDPPVMYFYNVFLASSNGSKPFKISLFSKGQFSMKYSTRNVVLYFLARLYDAITGSNINNVSYPNILNLGAQKAVQEVSLINNTTSYLYAWYQYPSTSFSGEFLLFLSYDLDGAKLSSPIARIEEGFVITDKALIASASTTEPRNYYVKALFYNNSSFIVRKLPLNLSVTYKKVGSSYTLDIYTSNGTVMAKEFNETNIVLLIDKPVYEDKYISIILEKVWLYRVLNEPVASILLKIISKRALLSVLAYRTRNYLEIYNDAYPLKPVIEPLVVQQYYDGKILYKNSETYLFIQARYITRYGGSSASIFIMRLPYIVVATNVNE